MSTTEHPMTHRHARADCFDEQGFPWFENGERMDRKMFHERYLRTPEGYKAELIGGIVYVMASPLRIRHGRSDFDLTGWMFLYRASTPGTVGQANTTTILGDDSEPQPDSALLIRPDHGGQTRDGEGEDDYTYGPPELIVEVAVSSRAIDLNGKYLDYERAGVLEYVVADARNQAIHWFARQGNRFVPLEPSEDGLYRSRVFPGLWLDAEAFFRRDSAALLAALARGLASPEHAAFVAELQRRKAELGAINR